MPPQFVIIGSGIAGLSAAEALRERLPGASIVQISEEPHHYYSRPGLAYLLRGDIPENMLYCRTPEDVANLGINRINARAEKLLCDSQEVLLNDGRRLRYDRLLLATGSLSVAPPFPGGNLAGVVKLDSLDDTRHILKLARRGKPAVVVGGGITALELAEGLHARGMKVHYFLRGDRYWSDVLDPTESAMVMDRLRQAGIVLHLKTQVKQAVGNRGQLTAVETDKGETVPCQVLAVAIGVRPRIELAKAAALKADKGVLVDPYMQTSRPGVFAAGDVAQVGSAPLDVLWPTALMQGRIAGANMAGARTGYVKGTPCNVTMLANLKVTIIGTVGGKKDRPESRDKDLVAISRGDSEAWRVSPAARVLTDQEDVNRVRLFIGERTIVGAMVMGDQTWSQPLQRLISSQVDITPVRPALIGNDREAMGKLANFFQQWEGNIARR